MHRVAWAVLGLLILVSGDADAQQSDTPTFRAQTYAVSFEVSIFRKALFRRSSPYTGLQVSDFGIVMDGKRFDADDAKEVRPGSYLISFTPSDEQRDGKEHVLSLRIRKWDTGLQKTVTIPMRPAP